MTEDESLFLHEHGIAPEYHAAAIPEISESMDGVKPKTSKAHFLVSFARFLLSVAALILCIIFGSLVGISTIFFM